MTEHSECTYCTVLTEVPTVDHVIPRAWGGPNVGWNRVPSCHDCNQRKGRLSYEYFTGELQLPAATRTGSGFDTTGEFLLSLENGAARWQGMLAAERAVEAGDRERRRRLAAKPKKVRRKSKKSMHPDWWMPGYDKRY